jgi:hypothetical protein
VFDQDLADYKGEEYVWQDGQWCLGGLARSQKRMVQRLKNQELREEKRQVWRAKKTADKGKPSANIGVIFILPAEFRALHDQDDEHADKDEEPDAQLIIQAKSATFNKLENICT